MDEVHQEWGYTNSPSPKKADLFKKISAHVGTFKALYFLLFFLLGGIGVIYVATQQTNIKSHANLTATGIEFVDSSGAPLASTSTALVNLHLIYVPPATPSASLDSTISATLDSVATASAFPTSFRVANSVAELPTAIEQLYTASGNQISWTLTQGDGLKIVYVQFKLNDVWLDPVSATINLTSSSITPSLTPDLSPTIDASATAAPTVSIEPAVSATPTATQLPTATPTQESTPTPIPTLAPVVIAPTGIPITRSKAQINQAANQQSGGNTSTTNPFIAALPTSAPVSQSGGSANSVAAPAPFQIITPVPTSIQLPQLNFVVQPLKGINNFVSTVIVAQFKKIFSIFGR